MKRKGRWKGSTLSKANRERARAYIEGMRILTADRKDDAAKGSTDSLKRR